MSSLISLFIVFKVAVSLASHEQTSDKQLGFDTTYSVTNFRTYIQRNESELPRVGLRLDNVAVIAELDPYILANLVLPQPAFYYPATGSLMLYRSLDLLGTASPLSGEVCSQGVCSREMNVVMDPEYTLQIRAHAKKAKPYHYDDEEWICQQDQHFEAQLIAVATGKVITTAKDRASVSYGHSRSAQNVCER